MILTGKVSNIISLLFLFLVDRLSFFFGNFDEINLFSFNFD